MTASAPPPERTSEGDWPSLVAMAAANLVVTLDFFGLNTALPSIGRDLGADTQDLQWIANVYLLTLASLLIPAGRLGDLVGRRLVCTGGLAVFAIASGLALVAQEVPMLVGARALAGVGAAAVTATSLAIVNEAFPNARRAFAIGVWSAIGAVGSAIGPLFGGVVTQLLSWRWFFGIGAALATAAIVVALVWVRETRDTDSPRVFDTWGTLVLSAGLALVVYGLIEAPTVGWQRPGVVASLVIGAVLLGAFVPIERRVPVPLVEFRVFERPRFVSPTAVAFVANFAFAVAMLYIALYLQSDLGVSPAATGAVFLALTIPLAALSPRVGLLVNRVGARPLLALGCAFLVASFAVFGLLGSRTGLIVVIVGLFLSGVGQALAFNVSNIAALAAVPDDDVGVASGTVNGVRQVGGLFGLAAAAAVYNNFSDAGPLSDPFRPTMWMVAGVCALAIPIALRAGSHARA